MAAPLAGMRVIDLTEGDGAPFAAMLLGDAGAEVIKVEPPAGDWARPLGPPFDHGDGPLFLGMNRNKRSLAVDIEREAGAAVVGRLAAGADVLVHSFPRAEDAGRLGLEYDALRSSNPRLIYCDLSTLERHGPEADRAATDLTVQGRAGITRFVGERGAEPLRFGTNYAGITAALYAVQAILAAFYWRQKTGEGQRVETSYLRAMIATQQNYLTAFSAPEVVTSGFYTAHLDPPHQGWPTRDRRVEFNMSRTKDPAAIERFLEAFGLRGEVEADPRFTGGIQAEHQEELRPYIEAAFRQRSSDEVLRILDDLGFMCAPINDYDSLLHDPAVLEQQAVIEVQHPTRGVVKTTGLAWNLTESPGSVRRAPPLLGEHTDAVLAEIGYDQRQIDELRRDGVIV